jgi:hypothetical protein
MNAQSNNKNLFSLYGGINEFMKTLHEKRERQCIIHTVGKVTLVIYQVFMKLTII